MCEQFPWFLDTIEEELQRGRTPPSTLTLEWLVSAVDSSTTPSRRVGGCLGHLLLTLPEQVHRLPQLLCASVGGSVSVVLIASIFLSKGGERQQEEAGCKRDHSHWHVHRLGGCESEENHSDAEKWRGVTDKHKS